MRSLRDITVDERIRLEGRDARALAALAWLERVVVAVRDEQPERLEALAADPPDPNVFARLAEFAEHQRWELQLAAINLELDRMGVEAGAPGARLQQLVARARINWRPRGWKLWRREGRAGAWVRLGEHSFHVERAEAVAIDAHWATLDGVRVPRAKLDELGVRVSSAALAPVPAPAPQPVRRAPTPPKPAKRKTRASPKRAPVITRRGVAWGAVTVVGVIVAFAARDSGSARVPIGWLFFLSFLAFAWWSRRQGKPLRPRRERKKRRATQLDLSFIPLLQRDAPHPVEPIGKPGRPKRERKPRRR